MSFAWITDVQERIQDAESKLNDTILIACLTQALAEYSQARPQTLTNDVSGSDSGLLDVPADWTSEAKLLKMEPLDDEGAPETALNHLFVLMLPAGAGYEIFWEDGIFNTAVTYRLTYTLPHAITNASETVPSSDQAAVMDLAASHACLRLAAVYAQSANPELGTVIVDYKTKSGEYRALAQELRSRFDATMQIARGKAGKMRSWQPVTGKVYH